MKKLLTNLENVVNRVVEDDIESKDPKLLFETSYDGYAKQFLYYITLSSLSNDQFSVRFKFTDPEEIIDLREEFKLLMSGHKYCINVEWCKITSLGKGKYSVEADTPRQLCHFIISDNDITKFIDILDYEFFTNIYKFYELNGNKYYLKFCRVQGNNTMVISKYLYIRGIQIYNPRSLINILEFVKESILSCGQSKATAIQLYDDINDIIVYYEKDDNNINISIAQCDVKIDYLNKDFIDKLLIQLQHFESGN